VNIDILKTFLENLDYRVLTARDGEEVINTAEAESPDLIISVVMIPKTDGFIVRERLLMQSNTKEIPFIIVSHLKDEYSVQRAANLGIGHYFKKPYMLLELLGVIKNTIKGEANS
jgi:DNA-binding response OmpR family regulator